MVDSKLRNQDMLFRRYDKLACAPARGSQGADPDRRAAGGGNPCATFAVNRRWLRFGRARTAARNIARALRYDAGQLQLTPRA